MLASDERAGVHGSNELGKNHLNGLTLFEELLSTAVAAEVRRMDRGFLLQMPRMASMADQSRGRTVI